MRRILALFLSVIMLFSFIPDKVEAKGYIKDIDALFGKFQLTVNGKKIANHRETFIYDEDIFVSLSDLARGLEIGMSGSGSGNTIHLDSKGKLSSNPDSSNQSIVFQRGYEISAKERIMDSLDDEIAVLNGKKPTGTNFKLESSIRSIKVSFGNLSIYLDKKKLNLGSEILKYQNDVYVALDSIAPYLYITPSMSDDKAIINIDSNSVLVKNNNYANLDALLGIREGRNYLLDQKIAELENRKYIFEEYKLPYRNIRSIPVMESYLNQHFKYIGELDVKISLVKQSNWINLDISFPSSKNYLWHNLKRSEVEQWIWNIYTAIVNLYDKEALISGVVRNPFYSNVSNSRLKNYVSFYNKDKDIYFDFTNSRLKINDRVDPQYLVEYLNVNLNRYYNIGLDYEANMTGDSMELLVYPNSNTFNQLYLSVKLGYLESLNQKIRTLYPDLNVDGKIIYKNIPPLEFHISENRFSCMPLLEDTVTHLNNVFSYFIHGNDFFRLKYSIYEKDLKNFHFVVESDFSINEEKWINLSEEGVDKFNNHIHSALKFIFSLWSANVSTEIVDKNGIAISDFTIYQETVSTVYATPPGGQVVEGSIVHLWTNTINPRIYYTTDGSTPTTSSPLYNSSIGIAMTKNIKTINAIAHADGLAAGNQSTFNYTVVDNPNLTAGLINLTIAPGELSPAFSNNGYSYILDVTKDVNDITIATNPTNVEIKVDGVVAGTNTIPLSKNLTIITISVKEVGKEGMPYIIEVRRQEDVVVPGFRVNDLRFSTMFKDFIFSGKVSHNNISNFSGYTVKLYSTTGKLMNTQPVVVAADGKFEFPKNLELDWFDKIAGFKYEVYNLNTDVVFRDNLN